MTAHLPLPNPMPAFANIAHHLPRMAEQQPDHPAVKIPRGRTKDGRRVVEYSDGTREVQ